MSVPDPIVNVRPKFTKIFINNEWIDSISGNTFPTYSPIDESKICDIQEGGKNDIDNAVKAARKAFAFDSEWRRMDATDRGKLISKLADLMERDRVFLASLETLDNGKPYALSYNLDLSLSIDCYRYHAGWADKIHGKVVPIDGDFFAYTRYEPIGVCGQIVPWNVPLIMMAWKLAPALTCGNTIVLKPSELTTLTALHVCSLIKEVGQNGFPPGVVNVVPGYGETGKDLSSHMDVDKISFTGSLAVGKQVMEAAAKSNLKTCLLELGGKSPNIVFADADLDYAIDMSHEAVFFNQGQVCCSGARTYVEESIYDEFVKKSVKKAKSRKLGDPWSVDTQQGPQINEKQLERILCMIESGKAEGATLECGGAEWEGEGEKRGFYVQPTVFSNVKDHMLIAREEIFGPVQQIIKFTDIDDVIAKANDTCYGLAAGVFTKDMDKAITVSHRLQAGSVWVNTYYAFSNKMPFGGYKRSGQGREMGEDGLREYCNIKSIVTKISKKIS